MAGTGRRSTAVEYALAVLGDGWERTSVTLHDTYASPTATYPGVRHAATGVEIAWSGQAWRGDVPGIYTPWHHTSSDDALHAALRVAARRLQRAVEALPGAERRLLPEYAERTPAAERAFVAGWVDRMRQDIALLPGLVASLEAVPVCRSCGRSGDRHIRSCPLYVTRKGGKQ